MPTYVYRRPDGTTFEAFQRISDDPLTEDPETGAPVVRVISGGAGLQFKGDGFYLTDYARKPAPGKKEGGSDEGSSSKDSAPKKSTSSDTASGSKGSSSSSSSKED